MLYIFYTYYTHILYIVIYIYRSIQILHIIIELSSGVVDKNAFQCIPETQASGHAPLSQTTGSPGPH